MVVGEGDLQVTPICGGAPGERRRKWRREGGGKGGYMYGRDGGRERMEGREGWRKRDGGREGEQEGGVKGRRKRRERGCGKWRKERKE